MSYQFYDLHKELKNNRAKKMTYIHIFMCIEDKHFLNDPHSNKTE